MDISDDITLVAQQALKAANYNPGALDGEWGPKTEAAFVLWAKANGQPVHPESVIELAQAYLVDRGYKPGAVDGKAGPKTQEAIERYKAVLRPSIAPGKAAARIVAIALAEVGTRETSRNQGPGIGKYWEAVFEYPTGYKNREPWCAAFVCWVIRQAFLDLTGGSAGLARSFKLPGTAAAFGFDTWAQENTSKGVRYRVPKKEAQAGDIVVFGFSHVGFVIGRKPNGDLITVEGNTNAQGSREGNGVWGQKVRSLSEVRSIHRILD